MAFTSTPCWAFSWLIALVSARPAARLTLVGVEFAPGANSTPTSVSRAAGLALTKAMSQENAQHGVLVNAMLVGLIESDQWARRHKTAAGAGKTYEEFLKGMAGRIPLGRMGKAEEFARMACFLCSDAGSFITGVAINVDGGASPVV